MPTYQYACTECGHRFEAVQTFHEDSLTHCPVCDGRLRKVFNAVGVVFKGSGFYRNDSRDNGKPANVPAAASGSSESASSGSSDSSSSTKADAAASASSSTTSDSSTPSSTSSSGSSSGGASNSS